MPVAERKWWLHKKLEENRKAAEEAKKAAPK
jgi:hypothetical protein